MPTTATDLGGTHGMTTATATTPETVTAFAARILTQAHQTTHPHSYVQAWRHALTEARAQFATVGPEGLAHENNLTALQAKIDALAAIDDAMQQRVHLLETEVDVLLQERRETLAGAHA